ncbi:MAG: peptide MFS transporter [Terrisporobacter sp.]
MTALNGEGKIKQPKDLYFCGVMLSFTGFSYYAMKLVLLLFLAEAPAKGGLGLTSAEATIIMASLMAWSYLSPIVGGWISDRFLGPKRCISIGLLILSAGYLVGFFATSKFMVQIMILLCVIGPGLYKGNLQTLVGNIYSNDDPRKDGAFSIAYMFTNIGVFFGPLLGGLVANQWFANKNGAEIAIYGYKYVFLLSAIVAFIGFIVFTIGQRKYCIESINNNEENDTKALLEHKKELAAKPLTKKEKEKMVVILTLAFFTVFFWLAYNQASMSIALYTQENINLAVGNFQVPTSWIDSYNGLLCVLLGPVMAAIWLKMSKTKRGDLSIPLKMSLGFIFLAGGFAFMIGAVMQSGYGDAVVQKASIFWLIAFLTLQTVGEMCFAPVGYGMVNKLAPAKYSSLFMGVWFASTFFANKLAGYVQVVIDNMGILQVFIIIPVSLLALGLILAILNKKLEQLASDDNRKQLVS